MTKIYLLPVNKPAKFPLGRIVTTSGASEAVSKGDIASALSRHVTGDWGDVSKSDAKRNERALENGLRVFSAYRDRHGVKFWIITEADRSVTTILLPEEY